MTVSLNTLRIAALLGVAVIAIVARALLGESDKARIRRRFESVEELVHKDGPENPVATALRARRLAARMAPSSRFVLPEFGFDGYLDTEAIERETVYVLGVTDTIRMAFRDLDIRVAPGGTASATATLVLTGTSNNLGFRGSDMRRLSADLVRSDRRNWLFQTVKVEPDSSSENLP